VAREAIPRFGRSGGLCQVLKHRRLHSPRYGFRSGTKMGYLTIWHSLSLYLCLDVSLADSSLLSFRPFCYSTRLCLDLDLNSAHRSHIYARMMLWDSECIRLCRNDDMKYMKLLARYARIARIRK
jgi:hypothetical protein